MKFTKIWAVRCASCIVMKAIYNDVQEEFNITNIQEFDFDNEKEKFADLDIWTTLPVLIISDDNWNELEKIKWEISKKKLREILQKYI